MKVKYLNVLRDKEYLELMLQHSAGKRKVPVIVSGDVVTIGFKGKY
jgi:glutaredoxin